MGVIVSSLISADGVRDEPMSWIGDLFDADAVEGSIAQLKAVDAFLMGRRSYDVLRAGLVRRRRPVLGRAGRAGPEVRLLRHAGRARDWANTTIVRTDAVEAVRALGGTSTALRLRPAGAVAARGRAGRAGPVRRAAGGGPAGPDPAAAVRAGPARERRRRAAVRARLTGRGRGRALPCWRGPDPTARRSRAGHRAGPGQGQPPPGGRPGLRSDGYHELVTVFHAIALYDEVTVAPAPSADGRGAAARAPTSVPTDERQPGLAGRASCWPSTPASPPDVAARPATSASRWPAGWPAAAPTPPPRWSACDALWGLGLDRRRAGRAGRRARQRRRRSRCIGGTALGHRPRRAAHPGARPRHAATGCSRSPTAGCRRRRCTRELRPAAAPARRRPAPSDASGRAARRAAPAATRPRSAALLGNDLQAAGALAAPGAAPDAAARASTPARWPASSPAPGPTCAFLCRGRRRTPSTLAAALAGARRLPDGPGRAAGAGARRAGAWPDGGTR